MSCMYSSSMIFQFSHNTNASIWGEVMNKIWNGWNENLEVQENFKVIYKQKFIDLMKKICKFEIFSMWNDGCVPRAKTKYRTTSNSFYYEF